MSNQIRKTIFVVLLELVLASISLFRLGQVFDGDLYNLYYGYFGDIQIPFGAYFLLSINEESIPFLRSWLVKFGIVFLVMASSEVAQFFGIELFGVTFDPYDILAYGIGASLAAIVDVKVFTRYLSFWKVTDHS
ncbi:MAG: hypothetical protein HOD43_01095 [Candidatus Marinimicrobia bacterium]|nr:hypothetical protein [Candidatus Neomarinimicrobiota bacterium]MBT3629983.1 hypothetical protein [Candidatus Neomarinimicrobiota bacterium]MBT3823981.1 hypothetical protein [Candidatus Neomarinimicrobiota bacterium]MBT4131587.1 hypothetical protein [Candidatus Neomarinimicrobiota bacterium]MBT4294383.1 hypothetical protein [Candidatus Neomarinimicrobiota bacterium]